MSNGAAGRAIRIPQVRTLLKPKVMQMMAVAASSTPKPSIFTSGRGVDALSLKLRRRMAAACTMSRPNATRHPTHRSSVPMIRKASTPAIARAEPSQPSALACWAPR